MILAIPLSIVALVVVAISWCSRIAARSSRGEDPIMKLSRRTFFKVNVAGAAALAVAAPRSAAAASCRRQPARPRRARRYDPLRRLPRLRGGLQRSQHAGRAGAARATSACSTRRATRTSTHYTVVNRFENVGGVAPVRFVKTQCMHCVEPACVSACPARALEKTADGPVTYTGSRCLGLPLLHGGLPVRRAEVRVREGRALREEVHVLRGAAGATASRRRAPRSARAARCSSALARSCSTRPSTRIYQNPDKYVHHIYGEHEAGGTSWLYISDVPLERLGLKGGLSTTPYPELTKTALVGGADRHDALAAAPDGPLHLQPARTSQRRTSREGERPCLTWHRRPRPRRRGSPTRSCWDTRRASTRAACSRRPTRSSPLILAVGIPVIVYRFVYGLGAATNLSQTSPVGPLDRPRRAERRRARGRRVHDRDRGLHLRPREVPPDRAARRSSPAFLGYLFVVIGLLFDLGQPVAPAGADRLLVRHAAR